jgi:hypothetical protein
MGATVAKQIFRVAKLKGMANIQASAEHTFRERDTQNANPDKARQNAHSTQNAGEVVGRVGERLKTVKTVRKNAVRCLEFLVTASPDFFKNRTGGSYFDDAKKFLEKKFGVENVVSSHVHRDETTPHAVFYVVPIDAKGNLNARGFIGQNRNTLSLWQDEFFKDVAKKYKLGRGVKGSRATHKKISEFYALAKRETPPPPTRAGLLLMSEEERLDTVKTLHAQASYAKAKLSVLADERKKHIAKIEQLEAFVNERKEEMELVHKAAAKLIKNAYTPAEFAQVFGVELKGKADIFDSLVKAGKAASFSEAVAQVALKMPSKTGAKWSDLAVEDLNFRRGLDGLEPLKTFEPVMPSAPQSAAAKRPKPR